MGQSKRRSSKAPTKQGTIIGAGKKFYPLLKAQAPIGKFIHVPGSYWERCPIADKEKIYKCLVVEFIACHDFGHHKSNGYKVCARLPAPHLSADCLCRALCHRLLMHCHCLDC